MEGDNIPQSCDTANGNVGEYRPEVEYRRSLVSLLIVSLLFAVFSSFRFSGFALDVNFEQFLTLSLFFVVSIFYVFLAQQLARDARLSRAVLEEKRNAEIMIEITRGLSISL